jgi:hypothetical protein
MTPIEHLQTMNTLGLEAVEARLESLLEQASFSVLPSWFLYAIGEVIRKPAFPKPDESVPRCSSRVGPVNSLGIRL